MERDASAQQIDIQQLRRGIAQSPRLNEALAEAQFVATGEWFLSGYVAMAIAPLSDLPITCIGVDPRGFAYWKDSMDFVGQSGIYVATDRFGQLDRLPDGVYQTAERLGGIELLRGGQAVQQVSLYRLQLSDSDRGSELSQRS